MICVSGCRERSILALCWALRESVVGLSVASAQTMFADASSVTTRAFACAHKRHRRALVEKLGSSAYR
jgi:hypothetical protein